MRAASKASSKASVPTNKHSDQTIRRQGWLRLLVQFRKAFIDRLLAKGEESAETTAGDYQCEAAEKDREYDSTASALEEKRELNAVETTRLKQLRKKLVRMLHPDLHEHDWQRFRPRQMLDAKESLPKCPWQALGRKIS